MIKLLNYKYIWIKHVRNACVYDLNNWSCKHMQQSSGVFEIVEIEWKGEREKMKENDDS